MTRSLRQRTLALAATIALGVPISTPAVAAQTTTTAAQAAQPVTPDRNLISADRPGIADGSGVIGRGQLQLEIGLQREFRDEDATQTRASFLPTLLRVGLASRLEARVETNAFAWTDVEDATGTVESSGWSPVSLGAKVLIVDSSELYTPSLGVIARVSPSSGSGPLRTSRVTGDVRLAADFGLSETLSLNPNVGIGRYEDLEGNTVAAAAAAMTLSYQPSPRLNPFVDIAWQGRVDAESRSWLVIDAGLAYIVSPGVQLDVSFGSRLHGSAPQAFFSFGVSLRSGR